MTNRQQFRQWLQEDKILNDSEETLTEMFKIAMDYRKTHPDLRLKSLYTYARLKLLQEGETTYVR